MKILLENHKFARYFLPHPLNVHRKCVIRAYLRELGRLDTFRGSNIPLGAEIGPTYPALYINLRENVRKSWIFMDFHENPEIFQDFPSSPYVNCTQTQQKIISPAENISTTPTCTSKRCYSDVVRRDLSIEHGFRSIRAMVEKIWSDLGSKNPLFRWVPSPFPQPTTRWPQPLPHEPQDPILYYN